MRSSTRQNFPDGTLVAWSTCSTCFTSPRPKSNTSFSTQQAIALPGSVVVSVSSDRVLDPVVLEPVIEAPTPLDGTLVNFPTLTLRQSELAQRLGVSHQVLSCRRSKPEFSTWSKIQDPEAKGWRYDAATKRFEVIEEMDSAIAESNHSSFQPVNFQPANTNKILQPIIAFYPSKAGTDQA